MEAGPEAATSSVDSDGSFTWEDFFGTSTDLVPQLLGMFDELARRGNGYSNHVVLPSSCNIPAALQKRLSLVSQSHRESILGPLCSSESMINNSNWEEVTNEMESDKPLDGSNQLNQEAPSSKKIDKNDDTVQSQTTLKERSVSDDKSLYHRENNDLTALRYSRHRRTGSRPLSGSSIASSTSSSGCSNQENTCPANPCLTSVESLADTCASSQGSGDSGVVVTVSEASCRIEAANSINNNPLLHHRPRYCDPHRNPVERVLVEIVDTEAIYVEHLRQVIQGYLIFWRDDPASLVHHLQLNDLFSNIEDIFEFNRQFLTEIENCGLDPICVANTFIKHNSGFKVYTEYCTNYPRTVSVLTKLMSQEELASAFKERQAALDHALPLGAYLLKPVQRILKYHLLLKNLSKEYGAGYYDKENQTEGSKAIEGALEAMNGIADHINAMQKKHEHAVRVQEIQSLLYGWTGPDLTTSGELVAEGRFRMRGAKAPRHAFLFEKMLLLTKKKEDGLLVYKTHIMCSNLMLIESIPGEPFSFHVIPFDNPRLQYTLQARNLEQKREWTLQIKSVILENYNAVIPSHARQLVLQLGQRQSEEDCSTVDKVLAKKQYSSPPEYLEKRKQERERRRSETGVRQKLKKGRKMDENSSLSNHTEETGSREQSLNRSCDTRASKVKDRFTSWRRKSEPGFQSYISLNMSDEEQKEDRVDTEFGNAESDCTVVTNEDDTSTINSENNSSISETKDTNDQQPQPQTVEEIVGHILMQNEEFQKLIEKQRTSNLMNVRQQRFNKCISVDSSDESDTENTNYSQDSTNNRNTRLRNSCTRREQRFVRTNNVWNSLSSMPQRVSPSLRLRYDNFRSTEDKHQDQKKTNRIQEKRAIFEAFKRQSIVTESKIIKTALRIRENSTSSVEENQKEKTIESTKSETNSNYEAVVTENVEPKGFENYDNLHNVWESLKDVKDQEGNDSPTRPAVWLTKLCEGLPVSPQKSGSLPRSFQISPTSCLHPTKPRFLQRDGKPMSERPFTIASDKPAEINLEDMERYASTCQTGGRIAKFPTSVSTSSTNFFCSLHDSMTDAYSELHVAPTITNVHPDHKIYRPNGTGTISLKNVLSKAGSRLQGLRSTASSETLEYSDELERTKFYRSMNGGKSKKKYKFKSSRESSSDVEEMVSPTSNGARVSRSHLLYYKQGSSSLGARIAQSDYADPTTLFSESKRLELAASKQNLAEKKDSTDTEEKKIKSTKDKDFDQCKTIDEKTEIKQEQYKKFERQDSEMDSFYERSFETIENYIDVDVEDAFRDSAIFSDGEDTLTIRSSLIEFDEAINRMPIKSKVAPPIPAKKRSDINSLQNGCNVKLKPVVMQKPEHLKLRPKTFKPPDLEKSIDLITKSPIQSEIEKLGNNIPLSEIEDFDDVSAGQSHAGWVKKMVGQLQSRNDT
ncbi:uncharacterized protein LOC122511380 isoform X2 [Leptopilina heterotoma]|uniref:uncharacterized protein LOC122511380 isoform X2 n=1 Tax=Leptopilina heterotoma TaxID=63436 RepID=UPI001CA851B8|nr:uncharacterized protein LOC122511380 isoform X2 [Leptopilina heterotoma]